MPNNCAADESSNPDSSELSFTFFFSPWTSATMDPFFSFDKMHSNKIQEQSPFHPLNSAASRHYSDSIFRFQSSNISEGFVDATALNSRSFFNTNAFTGLTLWSTKGKKGLNVRDRNAPTRRIRFQPIHLHTSLFLVMVMSYGCDCKYIWPHHVVILLWGER